MSQNWKKRTWGFKPQVENLEDRSVPAGNITAFVDGGVLRIRSDDDIHAFSISGCGDRSVMLRAFIGTTINGQTGNVYVGGITQGFDIQTGNSADSIVVSGVNGRNYLSIVTNGGDDAVHIVDSTDSRHSTWVRTGDGNDVIIVNGSAFREHFAIVSGNGDDRVDIGPNNTFGGRVSFDGGAGNDALSDSKNRYFNGQVVTNFETRNSAITPIVLNPTAVNDSASVAQNASVTVNVLANDTPGQGSLSPSTVTLVGSPTRGTAIINADGTIKYTASASASGTDSFTYTVKNTGGGTSNAAVVTISITDGTGPAPTITSDAKDQTNVTPIPATITFGEDVTGLTKDDFTVTNGTLSEITTVSGSKYTFTITPTAQGAVTVTLPAGKVKDSSNNNKTISNTFPRTFDTTAPTITANSKTTNDSTPTITGTVNDTTSTISVTVNGQTVAGTINGGTWSATLNTALADGKYTITATATDPAGNIGTATVTDGLVIDTVAPTVTVASSLTSPTSTTPIPFTITFSEDVTGFAKDLITISNGTIATFTATSGSVYKGEATPTADGIVLISVPAGKATDAAGNTNATSNTFQITFASANPLVTLTSTTTSPTNVSPIPVTATFTRNVTGFELSDLVVTNGTAGAFVAVDAKTYTFTVTPTGQGEVKVNIPAGAAKDADNKNSEAATEFVRVFDNVAPFVTIDQIFTNNTNPTITGTVEAGSTVEVSAGGKTGTATVTGTKWSFTFTQTFADGTYNITAAAKDPAGNQTPQLLAGGLNVDTVSPGVTITSTESSPSGSDSIPFQIGFAQEVVGFTQSDLVVTNGTISMFNPAGDDIFWDIVVTPTGDGPVTVTVPAAVATDKAGNQNTAGSLSIVSERFAPDVTITTAATSPTNNNPIAFVVTFSENVTGFVEGDIGVANGTISKFIELSASQYKITVAPVADGAVTISVAAGVAQDAGGKTNTAATDVTIISDRTAPAITISTTESSPTGSKAIPMTVTFNEDVTGFSAIDLVLTNGTATDFTAVSGSKYTFTLVPTAEGAVTVAVPANAATDTAGNGSVEATTFSITYNAAPSVTLSTASPSPTNSATITFTATFSDNVTGFEQSDVTVSNGTITTFTAVDAKTYTIEITPAADGDVRVGIAGGVAVDVDGIGNTPAADLFVTSDRTAPSAVVTTTASDPTSLAVIPFTITFNEAVVGFVASDVELGNGSLSNFVAVDSKTYTFDVTPIADGLVTITVAAAVCSDLGGNDNTAAAGSVVSDLTAPTTVVSTASASPTSDAAIAYTVTFSEDMTGFDISDLTVVNGTASNFNVVDAKTYTFDISPLADGDVTVSVAAGVATDVAGNQNLAGAGVTVVSDRTGPTTVISTLSGSPTSATSITFTVTFEADVTGFELADIQVLNGTASNFTAIDGKTYTIDVAPIADGDVTVSVPAGVAVDSLNNGNLIATDLTVVSDRTGPTTVISTMSSSPTGAASIAFTVTFSEDVTGFELADVQVVNGTPSNFTAVDGKTYTFDVAPTADGDVTVSVAAGVAVDSVNNGNQSATDLTIVSDRTGPTTLITTSATDPTSLSAIPFTITFSEDVTGFDLGDIVVANGTASNFIMTDARTYTFEVAPTADGNVTISVAAGVAFDGLGNGNQAATDLTIVSDRSAPLGTIDTTSTGAITGTATDLFAGVGNVQISIFDGTNYWDGTAFASATEVFVNVNTSNGFANWSYTIAAGTYTVHARITDNLGFVTDLTDTVVVS